MSTKPTMPDVDDGETVVVHILPPVMHKHPGEAPRSYLAPAAKVREQIAEGRYDDTALVTPTRPIEGYERRLNIEQMLNWTSAAAAMARAEGGNGLLLGHDPLRPDAHRDADQIVVSDQSVCDFGRDPEDHRLFSWDEVAAFSANRGSPTAEIYLTDGRAIFLHAAVDWDNRLS